MASTTQFPVNLVIPIASEQEGKMAEKIISDANSTNGSNTFLVKAYYEHHDGSQRARLLINGVEVKKGTVEQIKDAYRAEIGISQRSSVIMQEWQRQVLSDKPAGYVTVLSRLVRNIVDPARVALGR